MENPIRMDDLGVPLFSETSIWANEPLPKWADPPTWMSQEVSKGLVSGLFHPNIPHLQVGYNPLTNHLLTSWGILRVDSHDSQTSWSSPHQQDAGPSTSPEASNVWGPRGEGLGGSMTGGCYRGNNVKKSPFTGCLYDVCNSPRE